MSPSFSLFSNGRNHHSADRVHQRPWREHLQAQMSYIRAPGRTRGSAPSLCPGQPLSLQPGATSLQGKSRNNSARQGRYCLDDHIPSECEKAPHQKRNPDSTASLCSVHSPCQDARFHAVDSLILTLTVCALCWWVSSHPPHSPLPGGSCEEWAAFHWKKRGVMHKPHPSKKVMIIIITANI